MRVHRSFDATILLSWLDAPVPFSIFLPVFRWPVVFQKNATRTAVPRLVFFGFSFRVS